MVKNTTLAVLAFTAGLALSSAAAQEPAEEYEYDALGRLIKVNQTDGSAIDYTYDPAGNRKRVDIAGTGVSDRDPYAPLVIVVPLNGFVVIPIN